MELHSKKNKVISNEGDLRIPYEIIGKYKDSRFWTETELIKGKQRKFIQEKFNHLIEHKEMEIVNFFGTSQPHSSLFLLHHFKPENPINKRPILFVHGASHNAQLSWCLGRHVEAGIHFFMKKENYEYFAITFAHAHGDNHLQAIQVYNAILRIQEITKCQKVDVIAHSKGGVPTRLYLSNYSAKYGAPYLENVQKYIMLGTPNKGNDYIFRHVSANWLVLGQKASSPLAVDSVFYNGRYIDITNRSIYKDSECFTGQLQMLSRLIDIHPIRMRNKTLYEGGQNFYFHSRGIDCAIKEGGSRM